MNYDYTASESFCESIGLFWVGDDFVRDADDEAKKLNFTQEQVDAAMRHHLWQVKWLFTPKNFSWRYRIAVALFFLFGVGK